MIISTSMNIDFDRLLADINERNNTAYAESDIARILFNVINFTIHFNDKAQVTVPSAELYNKYQDRTY